MPAKQNPKVFPSFDKGGVGTMHYTGLSLRDLIALTYIHAEEIKSASQTGVVRTPDVLATIAYRLADAMLEAREK